MSKILITFGCSWTFGVGAGYNQEYDASDAEDFKSKAWDLNLNVPFSYRSLLCKKYNLENINFSFGGSSNQSQIRLAEEFFESEEFKNIQKKYKNNIYVLWAITSTARGEYFIKKYNRLKSIFYGRFEENEINFQRNKIKTNDAVIELSSLVGREFYDLDTEVKLLNTHMKHWNTYFKNMEIKNMWLDTFNHHNYSDPVDNLCFKEDSPRDLLSKITNTYTYNKKFYHISNWKVDGIPIEMGINLGVLNPYSKHPTSKGHAMIADILSPEIENLIRS